jgi:hypothetical protein
MTVIVVSHDPAVALALRIRGHPGATAVARLLARTAGEDGRTRDLRDA